MTGAGARAFWRTPRRSDGERSGRMQLLYTLTMAGNGHPFMSEAESTIWFRWRFAAMRPLGLMRVPRIGGGRLAANPELASGSGRE